MKTVLDDCFQDSGNWDKYGNCIRMKSAEGQSRMKNSEDEWGWNSG